MHKEPNFLEPGDFVYCVDWIQPYLHGFVETLSYYGPQ